MNLVQQNAASSAQMVVETKGRAKFSAKLARNTSHDETSLNRSAVS